MARNYSNIALDTTLTAGIGAGDASMVVASAAGWPAVPFAAVLDPGLVTEEVVQVTNKAGTTFTITRGFDGTTAAAHANGATVRHAAIAGDFTDLQAADSTNAAAIASEAGTRANADTTLSGLISTEATTRASADTALQTNITNEASARATADGLLLAKASNLSDVANTTTARGNLSAAPTNATYITQTANSELSAEQALSSLATGYVKVTTGTGVLSSQATPIPQADLGSGSGGLGTKVLYDDQTYKTPSGGVSDGDKGDITVSGSGATWTIDNDAVTYAKFQNVSATSRLLGRATAGAGDVEELTGAQVLSITGAQTAIAQGRAKSATTYFSLPGVTYLSVGTPVISANQARYMPIMVLTSITLDQLACEITTASAAATTVRMGIYNADTDWQPTSLVVDAGTVAADSLGMKTASISTVLAPGRYLLAINSDAAPNLRSIRGGFPGWAITETLGSSIFIVSPRVNQTYGAFPSTGTAWNSVSASSTPQEWLIFCRVVTP